MTYQESLAWLYATQQFGIKLGLANTQRLLDSLGDPQEGLRFIHVAGTNGKGSVCAMAAAILRSAGFKTGLYISPHLTDFRERICVNGEMIGKDAVARGLSHLRKACEDFEHVPTFFELVTSLAVEHFARSACDIVVFETGMGGRLDATNVVTPLVSVITPIAMDHSEWLGSTLADIAAEKAGIIKPGVPCVSAPQVPEVLDVLERHAARRGAPLTVITEAWGTSVTLAGSHQRWNAALAVAAIQQAGIEVGRDQISKGLQDVCWQARFQRLSASIIVDGAHNPHATAALVETWRSEFAGAKPVVIFGAMKDKDSQAMLSSLADIALEFWFVPVAGTRACDPADLNAPKGVSTRVLRSVEEALELAVARQQPVLITGSLFLAGEVLSAWEKLVRT